MSLRKTAVVLCLASLLFVTAAPRLCAQALYGSIVGSVTDSSGSVVPGALVRATQTGTGQERQTLTNEAGSYSFPTLPQGSYDVTIGREGFERFVQRGVSVTIANVVRVDAALKVGAATETVQVSAQASTLQTDKAEVRSDIATKDLEELPIPVNRNYQNLLIMVPGVSPPTSSSSLAANPARGEVFSVNGTTQGASNTRIEGANAINAWMSHETGYVRVWKLSRPSPFPRRAWHADQGLAGSAAINVQLKSGTSTLHGSGFEYNQNNAVKADPFFLPVGQRKPKFIHNQLGATLGGPIIKNKLFYFGSYDGQFIRQNASQITPPHRRQTYARAICRGRQVRSTIRSAGTPTARGRTPFPGSTIPQAPQDPLALRIQQLDPLPNLPGIANNYYATGDYSVNRHKFDGKINWNANQKLSGIRPPGGALNYTAFNPDIFGDNGAGVSTAAARDGNLFGTVLTSTLSYADVLSSHVVVDSYFGYTRLNNSQEPVSLDKGNLGYPVEPARNQRPFARLRRISLVQHLELRRIREGLGFSGVLPRSGLRLCGQRELGQGKPQHQVRGGFPADRQQQLGARHEWRVILLRSSAGRPRSKVACPRISTVTIPPSFWASPPALSITSFRGTGRPAACGPTASMCATSGRSTAC